MNEIDKQLIQLKKAFESGILDENTYRAAVKGLGGDETNISAGRDALLAKDRGKAYTTKNSQVGLIGDNASVEGGIHLRTGPDKPDPAEILGIYRRTLTQSIKHLPLRGVDVGVSDPCGEQKHLQLDRVYVELDTRTEVPLSDSGKEQRREEKELPASPERDRTRLLPALEAAVNNRRLVILGDPGSGKTTFVSHLTLCLASHAGEGQACQLSHWPEDEADITPIPVVLRDFALWLPENERKAEPGHLWKFIVSRLDSLELARAADVLKDALEKGKAVLLLDGLDEIPTQEKRRFVRDAVTAFAERYENSRCIVTCRVLSYQNREWQLNQDDFPVFELAPFDEKKVEAFISAWYEDLSRLNVVKTEEAEGLARRLLTAVRRPDLWRLAGNPLLLTVMALVNTHKGRLPEARALLYEETVDILLWRWEQIKTTGEERLPRLRKLLLDAGRADVDLKKLLWRLAFEAHGKKEREKSGSLADITEWELSKALAGLHPEKSLDWATRVIETVRLRAGLLLEREPGIYSFPHRTFQEYLAGAHLSSQADFAKKASALAETGSFWREVILLAVGRLVYLAGDSDKPLALVGELCPAEADDNETAWRKAWLAGDVLLEVGMNRAEDSVLGRDLAKRVRKRLADLIQTGRLEAKERVASGDTLAKLGDPRFNPDLWYLPDDEELGFVRIPAGEFLMGSDKERDKDAEDNELPHTVELSEYQIARYPVTAAQFRAFVQDSGYQPKKKLGRGE
ncbi:NACHT domain-containing protein [Desulfobacterales bacterium HSG2]|nr:NACHT domain-containing protein [Desulfobacterales bacterium HSG2]